MTSPKAKVSLVSLGCPKNRVDSEIMMGLLHQSGLQVIADADEADVVVVNTCGFIDPARDESLETILEFAEKKRSGELQGLVVAGCLVERHRRELREEIPEVDGFVGVNEIPQIVAACTNGQIVSKNRGELVKRDDLYLYDFDTPRLGSTPFYTSYVKISEGCDRPCTFCIIPKLRGPFRSRNPEGLEREVRMLVERGVREFNLIAQESTAYGRDVGVRGGLAELLGRLADIPGVDWLRVLYAYPSTMNDEVMDVLNARENICSYIDMPLQHSHRKVLSAMRRGGDGTKYLRMIERIRERVRNCVLRSTFIVGFPGEDDEAFSDLLDFLAEAKLDNVGSFIYSYSTESGAADLGDPVPAEEKEKRRALLMQLQAEISLGRNRERIGKELEILVEGASEEGDYPIVGRYSGQAPDIDGVVKLRGRFAPVGEFIRAKITAATEYDLLGIVVGEESEEAL